MRKKAITYLPGEENPPISVFTVRELPGEDRPREKLINRGPGSLTDSELLAILLRTGTKKRNVLDLAKLLLSKASLQELLQRDLSFFTQIDGIKKDKAATLMAAFELSRRIQRLDFQSKFERMRSPEQLSEMLMPILRDETQEVFGVVCLSSSGAIIPGGRDGFIMITRGTLDASFAPAREVMKCALEKNAKKIVLVHNHPSGNIEPSLSDKDSTRRIVEAGKLFGIDVIDHFIIGKNQYFSFATAGLM